ncbi:ABC transporter ATP-binding protein [uncultured Clostridium sp.]|jgi:putative ABC transport system ATP-binding protein|uniref:ABC transporter ATP-binding protein n=1 Tax=uncultured Clostridium sp. TaxID=59620 RepID=UPI002627A734|nr:ABC transporter ATP-binding protein [uncultured Clostridium sp.]
MKEIIKTENLCKDYNKFKGGLLARNEVTNTYKVIKSIDLTIYEGEFISVMGPSGSGKSTLLNLISNLDTPTKGNVFINGQKLRALGETSVAKIIAENIGFVFQNFNLIDLLTCRENIGMPLAIAGKSIEEMHKRIDEIAIKLGITDLLDKYPVQCSGGQQQRVAIARALISNPKIIIADEPTGNLDSETAASIMSIFKNLNEKDNITVLMVTHDALVASYSTKVLKLKDGVINDTLERKTKTQRIFFNEILDMLSHEQIIAL